MYLLILFLPLISAISAGFLGHRIGEKGAGYLTTSLIFSTCLISWYLFWYVGILEHTTYLHLFNWINSGNLIVKFGLLFDSVTVVMLIVVTTISTLVHLYSTSYMDGDPHLPRFMSYLSLFTFFMLVLVTADNFLQLFIGWEGVGICSYLLINFWYTRIQANKSAIKAMLVNRIGDIGLAIAMFAIYNVFGTLDFTTIFPMVELVSSNELVFFNFKFNALSIIGIFLLIGAMGKSAQIGLHTWLPDAMEGPTPVSALIHAATMVTAGIFLLIRVSPIIEFSPLTLNCIVIIGAITAFFAATVGLVQNDLKKVIAYSTCSQLGYMLFACGLSNYSISLFHLMNHAFFKALLFLSAGAIIHSMGDEQDMRKLGGLIKALPFTYSMILIGSLSLMGFPFLTGFYSKDAILEIAYSQYTIKGYFAFWLGSITALFTAFYSMRLVFLTFINNSKASLNIIEHAHESPIRIGIPLAILAIGSIFIGYLFKDLIIGAGTSFWKSSIFILPKNYNLFEAEFLDSSIKLFPVILSITGAILAIIFYSNNVQLVFKKIYTFLLNKWHIDYIYNLYIVKPVLYFSHEISFKILDKGLFELVGPTGIYRSIIHFTKINSQLQSGYIYNYAFTIFIFSTLFIALINYSTYLPLDFLIILPLILLII